MPLLWQNSLPKNQSFVGNSERRTPGRELANGEY